MKTNGVAVTRRMSAFEFYRAKQLKLKAKRKKPPTVVVTRTSGRKFLRSTTRLSQRKVPESLDEEPGSRVRRARSGKKRSKPRLKTKENVVGDARRPGAKEKLPEKVTTSDLADKALKSINEENPTVKVAVANRNGLAQKGYKVRILQSSNSARAPVEDEGRDSDGWMSDVEMLDEAAPEPPGPSGPPKTRPPAPAWASPKRALSCRSSVDEGRKLLAWLIEPEPLEEFLDNYWLKEPKLVRRNQPSWYQHLQLSCGSLDTMLRSNHLQYSKNLDITSYENGERETHNQPGRALPSQVWDYYRNGRSVRWLNPQTYSSRLWLLNASLQEFFGCLVGANVYLTPPNSQGFAPHFDDIEAFVLQLEGKKYWRLYWPKEEDKNPRYSSRNFKPEEIGEPFMEVMLHPGDLLYFPRGVIHQAVATDSHSLHVTLSCYQHNTWADLLEQVLPAALSNAIKSDPSFREGLPLGHQDYVGSNCTETGGHKRTAFTDKVKQLVTTVLSSLPIDEGVDRMGKNFMAEALPPCLTAEERQRSVYGSKIRVRAGGRVAGTSALEKFEESTQVKLVRRHCLRLVYEDSGANLYFSTDNTCEFQEVEPNSLELAPEMVPAVAMLIYAYPRYTAIGALPIEDKDTKINLIFDLWEKGLLLTRCPLTEPDDEGGASFQRVA